MKHELADRLAAVAREAALTRRGAADDPAARKAVDAVKYWQARRLAATHADLLAHPRYHLAARFFLEDIYEPSDAQWRDDELARVIPTLGRFLPEQALATVVEAVELDALSERLDRRLAACLAPGTGSLDEASYATADRAAGTPDERQHQLKLIVEVGASLDRLVRKPLLAGLLTAMGPVAHAAGLSAIHRFLISGFGAFRAMKGAERFLMLLSQRETDLMHRLFAGASDHLLDPGAGSL